MANPAHSVPLNTTLPVASPLHLVLLPAPTEESRRYLEAAAARWTDEFVSPFFDAETPEQVDNRVRALLPAFVQFVVRLILDLGKQSGSGLVAGLVESTDIARSAVEEARERGVTGTLDQVVHEDLLWSLELFSGWQTAERLAQPRPSLGEPVPDEIRVVFGEDDRILFSYLLLLGAAWALLEGEPVHQEISERIGTLLYHFASALDDRLTADGLDWRAWRDEELAAPAQRFLEYGDTVLAGLGPEQVQQFELAARLDDASFASPSIPD